MNLVPWYLLFLLILQHWEARRVPRRHSISSKLGVMDFLQFQITPYALRTFVYYFFGFSVMRAEFILDYWNKSDDFWHSLRSSRSSQSPESVSIYDRFKIYMIVQTVRIELNSIQAIEIVSVVRVVCDRLGSVSIWSSQSSEHFLRRLERSGRSRQSYGNHA